MFSTEAQMNEKAVSISIKSNHANDLERLSSDPYGLKSWSSKANFKY